MDAINKLIYKESSSDEDEEKDEKDDKKIKDVKSMEEIIRKRKEKQAFTKRIEKKMTELLELENIQSTVDNHRKDKRKVERSLENLAGQTHKLTQGQVGEKEARIRARIVFNADKTPDQMKLNKQKKSKIIVYDNPQKQLKKTRAQQKLFKKCFDKTNMGLGNLVNANEKVLKSRKDTLKNSFSILNRLDLDRPLLVKEKLLCLIADEKPKKKP